MNLMRKAAIAVLALSAASAFACENMSYGLGFGFSQNNSAINSTQTTSGTANNVSARIVTGGEALQGFGFVGFSKNLTDNLRASIQADLGFDGLDKTVLTETPGDSGSVTVNLKSGFYYGASTSLSVIRGDFAPYMLVGVRAGQWSANVSNTSDATIHGVISGYNTSNSETLVAPELGVGVNFTYSDTMDGRMEYKYMFGSTATASFVDADTPTTVNNQGLSVRQQSVQFSLVF